MYLFWSIITFAYVLIYCKYKFKNNTRNNLLLICALIISIGSYASLIYIIFIDIVPKLIYSLKKGEDMKDRLNTFLKLLRIKNDETLIEMSKKLKLSIVELSSIENNKKEIPEDFKNKIENNYKLTNEEKKELEESINLRKNIEENKFNLISFLKEKTNPKKFEDGEYNYYIAFDHDLNRFDYFYDHYTEYLGTVYLESEDIIEIISELNRNKVTLEELKNAFKELNWI